MNNQIFGLKFRQLRKQQHITLAKAAAGITSRQSLGNWETGKGELAFEKVLLLLKKINVQPIDFLEICEVVTSNKLLHKSLQLMLTTKLINYCIMLISILT